MDEQAGGRMRLLESLEGGEVNVEQVIARIEGGVEDRPAMSRPSPGALHWWWVLPFGLGIVLAGSGGILALQGGWLWLAALPLLAAGCLLLVLGAGGRDSARLAIKYAGVKAGGLQPMHLPLPLQLLAWAVQAVGRWIPELDEVLIYLSQPDEKSLPLEVLIDSQPGGKRLRLWAGQGGGPDGN
jgi:hypothetical protein